MHGQDAGRDGDPSFERATDHRGGPHVVDRGSEALSRRDLPRIVAEKLGELRRRCEPPPGGASFGASTQISAWSERAHPIRAPPSGRRAMARPSRWIRRLRRTASSQERGQPLELVTELAGAKAELQIEEARAQVAYLSGHYDVA